MKTASFALSLGLALGVASSAIAEDASQTDETTSTIYGFTVKNIQGEDVKLGDYKGKVLLMVNVASKCGLTPQYKELQALHEKYGDDGLAILAFPCNQFAKQEPGTNAEIMEFCSANYGVKFDMFDKIEVNGDDAAPLYKYLTNLELQPKGPGAVSWNFEKFVADKDGKVIARFSPRTKPDAEEVVSLIEKKLKD
jgi:glutathione peroxidase